jgi:hypothetical protein
MQGAGTAPRERLSGIAASLMLLALCLLCGMAPSAHATIAGTLSIDFSQPGQGSFDQSYFSGVRFTEGTFVGYIQGDEALVGPVTGSVKKGFASISAQFAPANQGTADYTLQALASSGRVVASKSVRVTQDTGDPETGAFGYASIELGPLARRASSFRLSNAFVRSSYSHTTVIEFGVSSITVGRY